MNDKRSARLVFEDGTYNRSAIVRRAMRDYREGRAASFSDAVRAVWAHARLIRADKRQPLLKRSLYSERAYRQMAARKVFVSHEIYARQ